MIKLESELIPKASDGFIEASINGLRRDAVRAHAMVKAIENCQHLRCICPRGTDPGKWFADLVEEEIAKTLKHWGWEYP